MAYPKIDQITVGNNPAGRAFGGYIYSANMQVGYQANPSTLILNIISEDGSYNISKDDLKLNDSPTPINIGGLILNFYLLKGNISKSTSGKTLTVTYIDQSTLLDRVYVGLLNEHTRKGAEKLLLQFNLPIICSSCDGSVSNRRFDYGSSKEC